MKKRAKRDLTLLVGAVAIIAAIGFFNGQLNRFSLINEMTAWRQIGEAEQIEAGLDLLPWELVRKTQGTLRKGGQYHPDLTRSDGELVNIVGFMQPLETFKDVTEFMVLPLPIECYFCEIPPAHDVMYVQMFEGETEQIWNQPVLIYGRFHLNEGPNAQFFYTIDEALLTSAIDGEDLTKRRIKLEHMIPGHNQDSVPLFDARPRGED